MASGPPNAIAAMNRKPDFLAERLSPPPARRSAERPERGRRRSGRGRSRPLQRRSLRAPRHRPPARPRHAPSAVRRCPVRLHLVQQRPRICPPRPARRNRRRASPGAEAGRPAARHRHQQPTLAEGGPFRPLAGQLSASADRFMARPLPAARARPVPAPPPRPRRLHRRGRASGGRFWAAARAAMRGGGPAPVQVRAVAALARRLGVGPGWLTPNISVMLRRVR